MRLLGGPAVRSERVGRRLVGRRAVAVPQRSDLPDHNQSEGVAPRADGVIDGAEGASLVPGVGNQRNESAPPTDRWGQTPMTLWVSNRARIGRGTARSGAMATRHHAAPAFERRRAVWPYYQVRRQRPRAKRACPGGVWSISHPTALRMIVPSSVGAIRLGQWSWSWSWPSACPLCVLLILFQLTLTPCATRLWLYFAGFAISFASQPLQQ